ACLWFRKIRPAVIQGPNHSYSISLANEAIPVSKIRGSEISERISGFRIQISEDLELSDPRYRKHLLYNWLEASYVGEQRFSIRILLQKIALAPIIIEVKLVSEHLGLSYYNVDRFLSQLFECINLPGRDGQLNNILNLISFFHHSSRPSFCCDLAPSSRFVSR